MSNSSMNTRKRPDMEVDILSASSGRTYTYTVRGCETNHSDLNVIERTLEAIAAKLGNVTQGTDMDTLEARRAIQRLRKEIGHA